MAIKRNGKLTLWFALILTSTYLKCYQRKGKKKREEIGEEKRGEARRKRAERKEKIKYIYKSY